jgi:hypothetical protein
VSIERVTVTALWYGGMNVQNVMAFDNPDGLLTPLQVAQEIRDGWLNIIKAKQSAYLSWRDIAVDTIGNPAPPLHLSVILGGLDSVDSGLSHPTVNWKLRITTGVGGKRGRGRIYIPGIRYSHWQFGQMTAFGVTDMQPVVDALVARYVQPSPSSGLYLGVMPRNGSASDHLLATGISQSLTPGIQRRRNIGVGI